MHKFPIPLHHIAISCLLVALLGQALPSYPKDDKTEPLQPIPDSLAAYFYSYRHPLLAESLRSKIQSATIDHKEKKVCLELSASFGYQPLRPDLIASIYRETSALLPESLRSYDVEIRIDGYTLEELVPNLYREKDIDRNRLLPKAANIYEKNPWVCNVSRPLRYEHGMEKKHIALWASHGRYYKEYKRGGKWVWQRPNLFCTTEDLFTRSFVTPYLIPMLEKSGASVFMPRERDVQPYEVIVDNDTCFGSASSYVELPQKSAPFAQLEGVPGFAQRQAIYTDGTNPFQAGTARWAPAERKEESSVIRWIPDIPEEGYYAVYVSYVSVENSISDAHYRVYHKGGTTDFIVNQRMGGGTWVYLGTFLFEKGTSRSAMVTLTNQSRERGVVTADAVRFGGGVGNIARGGMTSGLPRYLEGSRYYAQWAGMPEEVYYTKNGENDYAEDINARPLSVNYMSSGSAVNPEGLGGCVPFDLSLAVHSDAGYRTNDDLVGTLSIYTTDYEDRKLAAGESRLASRDLSDLLVTQLQSDLQAQFNTPWQRRYLWDRNYSETRNPVVPSAILEMFSHQNFADMQFGHDPVFKFHVARSIYKSILRFTAYQRNEEYVVQPLPPHNFSIAFGEKEHSVILRWAETEDPTEPTAQAERFILYIRKGDGGFDNGTVVHGHSIELKLEEGTAYSFRIAAANEGGESFPSETLTAYFSPDEQRRALIVNAFTRLSAPAVVNYGGQAYFDLDKDPGVPYLEERAYSGRQTGRDRSGAGLETASGWGYSGNELVGTAIVGNTFDYPYLHGKAMQATGKVSYVSCSREAFEKGIISPVDFDLIDLVCGLQKKDPVAQSLRNADYSVFTPEMTSILTAYLNTRTGKRSPALLISGAHIASDISPTPYNLKFLAETLHYLPAESAQVPGSPQITGMQRTFEIKRQLPTEPISFSDSRGQMPSEALGACVPFPQYTVTSPDCVAPATDSDENFALFCYDNGVPAGTAWQGTDSRVIALGFPFESIPGDELRSQLMTGMLYFLLDL
ncbi:MAG: fibronectin type III domain-containing protein [Bacteroidaceae bacterium]|jgi:hypothetical protein